MEKIDFESFKQKNLYEFNIFLQVKFENNSFNSFINMYIYIL